ARAARTSGASRRSAVSNSSGVITSSVGVAAVKPSKRAVSSRSAASPRARTSARIRSTARWISGGTAAGERASASTTAPRPSCRASITRIGWAEPRGLGGHPHPRPLRRVVTLAELSRLGNDEAAETEPQIERLVHVRLLLEKDVLADDPEIRGAVEDVRRDVGGLQEQHAQVALRVGEDQPARVLLDPLHANVAQEHQRRVQQPALGEREREHVFHARRTIRAPSAPSLTSRRS